MNRIKNILFILFFIIIGFIFSDCLLNKFKIIEFKQNRKLEANDEMYKKDNMNDVKNNDVKNNDVKNNDEGIVKSYISIPYRFSSFRITFDVETKVLEESSYAIKQVKELINILRTVPTVKDVKLVKIEGCSDINNDKEYFVIDVK